MPRAAAITADDEFVRILRERAVETVFQPIVHLGSMATVGYEALARGPVGSRLASAPALIEAAHRTGRLVEFDWVARASAVRAAVDHGLSRNLLLFLNVEPLALDTPCPKDLRPDIERAFAEFRIVLEITERSLDHDPRALFDGAARLRQQVEGLALDDVGSTAKTLAMLPVLSPDVIKLDLSVTQGGARRAAMKVLDIAFEESERTGATILAEGVETAEQSQRARTFGATLGQGHRYGWPGPLHSRAGATMDGIATETVTDVRTPFEALDGRVIGRATAGLLRPLAAQVTHGGTRLVEPALTIMLVPRSDMLTAADRRTLRLLAQRGVLTVVLGRGLPDDVVAGARGTSTDDPALDGEWAVVALGPGVAGAMLARRVDGAADEFEFGVTHDRRRVISAARCLLRRLGPAADLPSKSRGRPLVASASHAAAAS